MKKIFITLYDAGIANAIAAALPKLGECYQITVIAQKNLAAAKLKELLNNEELSLFTLFEVDSFIRKQAEEFIRNEKPDAIVTGISDIYKVPDKVDFTIPEAAAGANIPVIGIFEPIYLAEELITKRLNHDRHLPSKLIITSNLMKEYLIQSGLYQEEDLFIAPMPKYASYEKIKKAQDLDDTKKYLRQLNNIADDEFALIFSSSRHETDHNVILWLAQAVSEFKIRTLLTFHPKDSENFRRKCLEIVPNSTCLNIGNIPQLKALTALCSGHDGAMCSFKSSILFDVMACQGNTFSINPDFPSPSQEAGTVMGIIPCANQITDICNILISVRTRKSSALHELKINLQPVNDFVACLNNLL